MLAHYRRFRLQVFVILVVAIFPPLAFSADDSLKALEKKPVKVDFNDVLQENEPQPGTELRPAFRIAVAAMISPKYTYEYYIELLNLIGERIGRDVVFVQKKTYAEVNEMLKRNELDLAFVCSGPYVSGKEDFGMEMIAVPVCHDETVYYSYFIASRKSGIQSLDDFQGKTFAFTDPLSNTGYMVPTYYLALRDETPGTYFGKTFFTNSHDNSIQAVADGLADGAAVDSLIYEFMQARNPELTEKTIIVEKSPPYGIPPVVVAPSISPEMKENLTKIFLSIHESAEGKAILENIQVDRFVRGEDHDYDTVRDLQAFLKTKQH